MILMLLVASSLPLNVEPTSLHAALVKANRVVADCAASDIECIETVRHNGVLGETYKVRLEVQDVALDEESSEVTVDGEIRWKTKGVAVYRTKEEKKRIKNSRSLTSDMKIRHGAAARVDRAHAKGKHVGHHGWCHADEERLVDRKLKRKAEKRERRQEHNKLLGELNTSAQRRKDRIELVRLRVVTSQYAPEEFKKNKRSPALVVRVTNIVLRPGLDELGSPRAIESIEAELLSIPKKKLASAARKPKSDE